MFPPGPGALGSSGELPTLKDAQALLGGVFAIIMDRGGQEAGLGGGRKLGQDVVAPKLSVDPLQSC